MDFYCNQALADSTKRSYNSAIRRYIQFCFIHNYTSVPTNEHLLCRYVVSLANEGLSATTIKCYLSAICHRHITEGRGDPNIGSMPKLELLMRGMKMVQGRAGQSKPRQPITPDLLLKLRGVWLGQSEGRDGHMLWAASSLCFFGFLRPGEITVPTDTAFDSSAHLNFQGCSYRQALIAQHVKGLHQSIQD